MNTHSWLTSISWIYSGLESERWCIYAVCEEGSVHVTQQVYVGCNWGVYLNLCSPLCVVAVVQAR